jgi:Tol biopolymer transport system component
MRFINILGLLIVIFLLPSETSAAPPITWSQEYVSQPAIVGTVVTREISFTSSRALSNVRVRVVPELAPFVSTSPSIFDFVPAGEPQLLTIFFTIPKGTPVETLDGVIQIKEGNDTVARPLAVQVETLVATATDIPSTLSQPSPDRIVTSPDSEEVIFVKDEISIFFKEGTPASEVIGLVSAFGGVFLGSLPEVNYYQVQVAQEGYDDLSVIIDQLAQTPSVSLTLHHYFYKQDGIPLDPGSSESYAPRLINLPAAWDITQGRKLVGRNNSIELGLGVIDSGFAFDHFDLRDNIVGSRINNPGASLDHGTKVASIVAAKGNNGVDIAGVVWRASAHLYSVGSSSTPGGLDGNLVQQALLQVIKDKPRAVNMSFSFECSREGCTDDEMRTLFEASNFYRFYFDKARREGVDILWVCSAGNNGINHTFAAPARLAISYANVVSVSAVNQDKERAIFNRVESSNYGEFITVAAPGINVPALKPSGGYVNDFGGTSAAAPYITGIAGLALAVNPCLSAEQLKSIIKNTADGTGNFDPDGFEIRLANALRAVQEAERLGCRIVFTSERDGNPEIYVMNADGSGQVRLTSNPADDIQPVWSPDGRRIAFVSFRDGNPEIYVMNADGGSPTRLTNNTANDFDPAWSPGGTKIVFSRELQLSNGGSDEIFIMNADGSSQTRITFNLTDDQNPAWSPDGAKIVFDREDSFSQEIYVMNANGSGQVRLTFNTRYDGNADWSPDGTKIIFESQPFVNSGSINVFVMDPSGANRQRLTTTASSDGEPKWSPDGQRIAFISFRNGNPEIYVMNANGGSQTRLTNNLAYDQYPAWCPLGTH